MHPSMHLCHCTSFVSFLPLPFFEGLIAVLLVAQRHLGNVFVVTIPSTCLALCAHQRTHTLLALSAGASHLAQKIHCCPEKIHSSTKRTFQHCMWQLLPLLHSLTKTYCSNPRTRATAPGGRGSPSHLASSTAATCSSDASCQWRPMICSPTGAPVSPHNPTGTVMAG